MTDKWTGSDHYKTGGVEPLDLIDAGGMLWDKCVSDIIKYAFRNRRELGKPVNPRDIDKIHDMTDRLKAYIEI